MDADAGLAESLSAVARRLRHVTREALTPLGVTPWQARAVRMLAGAGELRPGALAERLRIAPRSATEVVDDLESRGLAERRPDPADRRATLVALTPAGVRLAERIGAARGAEADRFFAGLDAGERADLARILRKLSG